MEKCECYLGAVPCRGNATHLGTYTDMDYTKKTFRLCGKCAAERLNTKQYPWPIEKLS